jgi:hypothetical protein
MADHRIRLTDRELELARSSAWMASWALMPVNLFQAEQYKQLACRLEHTKAGGMPLATRKARKHFVTEASG